MAMERVPRVDVMFARAVDQQVNEQRSLRESMESMEERLETLEGTIAKLAARLRQWSDPGEVTEQVAGIEEEISVALGRFHKRLESVAGSVESAVRESVESQLEGLNADVVAVKDELKVLSGMLQRLPQLLADQRSASSDGSKRLGRGSRRRSRQDEAEADGDAVRVVRFSRRDP